jgi:hypothetical protein
MAVIHIAYAAMKMPGSKGVITIKADQRDALACKNTSLSYVGCFDEKAAQEQSAKVAKMQGGSTPPKTSAPKPPIDSTPQNPLAKKCVYVASPSTQHPVDQLADDKKKGAEDKEILADTSDPDKKLRISTDLDHK